VSDLQRRVMCAAAEQAKNEVLGLPGDIACVIRAGTGGGGRGLWVQLNE